MRKAKSKHQMMSIKMNNKRWSMQYQYTTFTHFMFWICSLLSYTAVFRFAAFFSLYILHTENLYSDIISNSFISLYANFILPTVCNGIPMIINHRIEKPFRSSSIQLTCNPSLLEALDSNIQINWSKKRTNAARNLVIFIFFW